MEREQFKGLVLTPQMTISEALHSASDHIKHWFDVGIRRFGALCLILLWNYFRKRLLSGGGIIITKENGMQVVQVQMDVPKEGKEVVDFLAVIVKDLKAKKSIAEIAGDSLPKLLVAIDGFDQLGEEAKSANKDELAGYLVQQTMDALGV